MERAGDCMKETKLIRDLCAVFGVREEDLLRTIQRMKQEAKI